MILDLLDNGVLSSISCPLSVTHLFKQISKFVPKGDIIIPKSQFKEQLQLMLALYHKYTILSRNIFYSILLFIILFRFLCCLCSYISSLFSVVIIFYLLCVLCGLFFCVSIAKDKKLIFKNSPKISLDFLLFIFTIMMQHKLERDYDIIFFG